MRRYAQRRPGLVGPEQEKGKAILCAENLPISVQIFDGDQQRPPSTIRLKEATRLARTIVIGGGVIGLLSAYELKRRQRDVIVVDKGHFRQRRVRRQRRLDYAVAVNAGARTRTRLPIVQVDAASRQPALRAAVGRSRHARLAAGVLAPLQRGKYEQGRDALAQLNRLALRDFDNLEAQGLDFEMHLAGLMYVAAPKPACESMLRDLEHWESYGPASRSNLRGRSPRTGAGPAAGHRGRAVRRKRTSRATGEASWPAPSSGCEKTASNCVRTRKW